MTFATRTARLIGHQPDGSPSVTPIPCEVEGALQRTLGLFGDDALVRVKASDWPGDTDLTKDYTIVVGATGAELSLRGYVVRSVDALTVGRLAPNDPATINQLQIRLATFPAQWREGRGGRLTTGVHNSVDEDGLPDPESSDYLANSTLAAFALDAMGVDFEIFDQITMDLFDPPGPLDWGNAHAPSELEALLARVGYRACVDNTGERKVRVVRLPLAGESFALPMDLAAVAEPFELQQQPPLTGSRIVVTSGDARSVIVRAVTLDDLEWVWFDADAGVWKNDDETTEGVKPGDISAYRAGPGTTIEEKQQFARLFRALRLKGENAAAMRRFTPIPRALADVGGFVFGGKSAALKARVARPEGNAQFRNEPAGAEDDPIDLIGVAADPSHGVFILPHDAEFVRMSADAGSYGDAQSLTGDDLTIVFAHEAHTHNPLIDFFVAGWQVGEGGDLEEVEDEPLGDLLADPDTIVVSAPFLRQYLMADVPVVEHLALNRTELKALAKQLAQQRASAAMADTGMIYLRGLIDAQPGDIGGAVSRVIWDVRGRRTILSINEHTVPDSVINALEVAARRSIVTGLNRYSAPGAHAAKRDVRAGLSAAVANVRESGAERSQGEAVVTRAPSPEPVLVTRWFARITGATPAGGEQFLYDHAQVSIANDGAVIDVANGRTSATHGQARNLAEMLNTGSGVAGNGIDRASLPDGWTLQPVGPRVVVMEGPFGDGAAPYCVFSATNIDDGECPQSGGEE